MVRRLRRGKHHRISNVQANRKCGNESFAPVVDSVQSRSNTGECSFHNSDQNETPNTSATPISRSMKKLASVDKIYRKPECDNSEHSDSDSDVLDCDSLPHGHRIVDIELFSQNISSKLVCSMCHGCVSLIERKKIGLASEFSFQCSGKECTEILFPSCAKIPTKTNLTTYSVNRRATLAMRCIGQDHSDLETFCGVMNLPWPAAKPTHQCLMKTIEKAATETMDESMKKAATGFPYLRGEYTQ